MIANNDMQGSLNIRKSLTMLQEELTDVLARVQHMKLVEAPWLHRRYVALFGAKNLHIMSGYRCHTAASMLLRRPKARRLSHSLYNQTN